MATLITGIDHYQIVSASGYESDESVYGRPCLLADVEGGDLLFAYLDIPAEDGSIRGAMGLRPTIYRLDIPDREEDTVLEDLPHGFDFEQESDYISPFDDDDDEDDEADTADEADEADTAGEADAAEGANELAEDDDVNEDDPTLAKQWT